MNLCVTSRARFQNDKTIKYAAIYDLLQSVDLFATCESVSSSPRNLIRYFFSRKTFWHKIFSTNKFERCFCEMTFDSLKSVGRIGIEVRDKVEEYRIR